MSEMSAPTPTTRPQHRYIRERWVIEGTLRLDSPAHFGAGEADDLTDMPIFLDEADGTPLLPGTSIAGALRNYLREAQVGYGVAYPSLPTQQATEAQKAAFQMSQQKERIRWSSQLFGGYRGDDEGGQSPFIVHDAPGRASGYELRDGVAIEGATRTAADEKKFDIQLLAADSSFHMRFELVAGVPQLDHDPSPDAIESAYAAQREALLRAASTALHGLAEGKITLGARKRRGYGRCSVAEWTVRHYDLQTRAGFLSWLASERDEPAQWVDPAQVVKETKIAQALGVALYPESGQHAVTLNALFSLPGSVMIRSGFGEADVGPDMIHLHAYRADGRRVPIIPGTSWAGVMRHRAEKIIRTLHKEAPAITMAETVRDLIDPIFGPADIKEYPEGPFASRLLVAESEITAGHSLVQSRVKIDSFTGGAYQGALFDEQPVFGTTETRIPLELTLFLPPEVLTEEGMRRRQAEVGLLLLLLKDFWTGDLRVGGEASVGRGSLSGCEATLTKADESWQLTAQPDGSVDVTGDLGRLEAFVAAFCREVDNA